MLCWIKIADCNIANRQEVAAILRVAQWWSSPEHHHHAKSLKKCPLPGAELLEILGNNISVYDYKPAVENVPVVAPPAVVSSTPDADSASAETSGMHTVTRALQAGDGELDGEFAATDDCAPHHQVVDGPAPQIGDPTSHVEGLIMSHATPALQPGAASFINIPQAPATRYPPSRKICIKEFCYNNCRSTDRLQVPFDFQALSDSKRRNPPSLELLSHLKSKFGEVYGEWQVRGPEELGVPNTSLLIYPFVEGVHFPFSPAQWGRLLEIVEAVHACGYVHGDILARNMVFPIINSNSSSDMNLASPPTVILIDFDFAKKEGEPYLPGFNSEHVERHSQAREGQPMRMEHDLYSLKKLTCKFFKAVAEYKLKDVRTVSELRQFAFRSIW